ncbi:MAG: decarboxylating 6-phosphogluconate dehydrogenase, partial [Spirochaetales bacterium]|nr:decarboxylating 6-phosphogluconate dehydrogenase [Spirochaetales bacterium]
RGFTSIPELLKHLKAPRIVWMMVPAGEAAESVIAELITLLDSGDIVVDGGNSRFSVTLRRGKLLEEKGIYLVDAGTSGGTEGARHGTCMMVGGAKTAIEILDPLLKLINVERGYLHCGRVGSGHYMKMVHNGIEYGMMQAIAEGLEIINKSEFDIDFASLTDVWNHGSIISGYLMQITKQAFENNGDKLDSVLPRVDSMGEGQWTVEEALRLQVSAPVISSSLFVRNSSRDSGKFSDRVVAAQRNEFGGHQLHRKL